MLVLNVSVGVSPACLSVCAPQRFLTKIETSSLVLLEEAATGSTVNICSVLYQQLHALQAPLLYGDVQRTVASVELIGALGIDKGLRIAGIPVDLQQRLDTGIDPVLKVQHSLHQTCLSSGAFCKERGEGTGNAQRKAEPSTSLYSKPRFQRTPWEAEVFSQLLYSTGRNTTSL